MHCMEFIISPLDNETQTKEMSTNKQIEGIKWTENDLVMAANIGL